MLDAHGHVKLVDFGLAKDGLPRVLLPEGEGGPEGGAAVAATPAAVQPMSPCGSIVYMAPELLQLSGGTSVDWWALGILMHEMLTGRSPWATESPEDILAELAQARPLKLSAELKPPAAKALVSGLLTRDHRKRLGPPGCRQTNG